MFRHIAVFVVGSVAIANLNAGSVQIQIGGVNGLTAGTVTQSVTGGATGTVGEMSFVGNIPPGSTSLTRTSGVPPVGYPNGAGSTQLDTVNDSGTNVTFAMINDSANPTSNMWISSNTGGTTGTPVVTTDTVLMGGLGVFGVSNVWTMLNDQYGNSAFNGGQNTQVTFDFTTSTGGFVAPLTFTLVNGVEIRDSVNCTAAGGATGTGVSTCTGLNFQNGLDTTNDYSPTGAENPVSGPDVSAFNVWTGTYNTGSGAYANTANGAVYLDAQNFFLGSAYANDYLTSIQVVDTETASRQSRDILTAITVEASAPEPSTWLLFAIGFGAIGIVRLRRKSVC
jgi:hypothetical protein